MPDPKKPRQVEDSSDEDCIEEEMSPDEEEAGEEMEVNEQILVDFEGNHADVFISRALRLETGRVESLCRFESVV